jgi:AraC-like DNA-binding protein
MSGSTAKPESIRTAPADPAPEFEFDVTLLQGELPELAVRWGGFQRLSQSSSAHEHVHYRYGFIIMVTTGYGRFSCGEKSWKLEPGVVFWARPNLTTRFEISPGSAPIDHYVVMPFGSRVADWFERYLGAEVGAAPVIDFGSTARMFQVIMEEGLGGGNHREENCVDLVKSLIRRLASQLVSGRALGNNSRETYVRALKHIQGNYSQIRDLGDVASATGVSVPYLCRLFERYGTSTAFDYLAGLKLTKAERLLCTRDLSIREIGEAVGYSDLQLFSRNFKSQYGLSPSYYRKARRNEHRGDASIPHTPPNDSI